MRTYTKRWPSRMTVALVVTAALAMVALLAIPGCTPPWKHFDRQPVAQAVGTDGAPVPQDGERREQTFHFLVRAHEFEPDSATLNPDGQEHVKQIAARLLDGQDVVVLVERSGGSVQAITDCEYRLHDDLPLDLQRGRAVVHALASLGIVDAERRVVVRQYDEKPREQQQANAAYFARPQTRF